jgi:hypothetical protein
VRTIGTTGRTGVQLILPVPVMLPVLELPLCAHNCNRTRLWVRAPINRFGLNNVAQKIARAHIFCANSPALAYSGAYGALR